MSKLLSELKKMKKLIASGYAGINTKGTIVDRRENPEAIAIQKNRLLGTPEPKALEGEE